MPRLLLELARLFLQRSNYFTATTRGALICKSEDTLLLFRSVTCLLLVSLKCDSKLLSSLFPRHLPCPMPRLVLGLSLLKIHPLEPSFLRFFSAN